MKLVVVCLSSTLQVIAVLVQSRVRKGVINRIWNWDWGAEEFRNETGIRTEEAYETYFGTNYHNANAGAHKILVEINFGTS